MINVSYPNNYQTKVCRPAVQTQKKQNAIKHTLISTGVGVTTGVLCYKNGKNLTNCLNKVFNFIKNLFIKTPKTSDNNILFPIRIKPFEGASGNSVLGREPHIMYNMSPNLKGKISTKIQEYLKNLKNGEEIDPAKLDEILTKMAGKNNTIELNFYENPSIGITAGRKKAYRIRHGNDCIEIHLECHTSRRGTVTRLYEAKKNGEFIPKPDRSYMFPDGGFGENAFGEGLAHLPSGANGEAWINQAEKILKVA